MCVFPPGASAEPALTGYPALPPRTPQTCRLCPQNSTCWVSLRTRMARGRWSSCFPCQPKHGSELEQDKRKVLTGGERRNAQGPRNPRDPTADFLETSFSLVSQTPFWRSWQAKKCRGGSREKNRKGKRRGGGRFLKAQEKST